MREVPLPSGAVLMVNEAPFADAKGLYQAILHELKAVSINTSPTMPDLYKSLFCAGFSSAAVEAWCWKCAARCLYDGQKVVPDTFEPSKAREDFTAVMVEVAKENVGPFVKILFAESSKWIGSVMSIFTRESSQGTTS